MGTSSDLLSFAAIAVSRISLFELLSESGLIVDLVNLAHDPTSVIGVRGNISKRNFFFFFGDCN